MKTVVESALRFYINHLKMEVAELREYGADVGYLPQYIEEAERELNGLHRNGEATT